MITQSQWDELVKVCPSISIHESFLKLKGQIVIDKVTYPQEQERN